MENEDFSFQMVSDMTNSLKINHSKGYYLRDNFEVTWRIIVF